MNIVKKNKFIIWSLLLLNSLSLTVKSAAMGVVEIGQEDKSFLNKELLKAVSDGNVSELLALLGRRADIDAVSKDGSTPLIIAASNGHIEVLNILLDKGANINASNKYGINALMKAAWYNYKASVKILSERGATVPGYFMRCDHDSIGEVLETEQREYKERRFVKLTEKKVVNATAERDKSVEPILEDRLSGSKRRQVDDCGSQGKRTCSSFDFELSREINKLDLGKSSKLGLSADDKQVVQIIKNLKLS